LPNLFLERNKKNILNILDDIYSKGIIIYSDDAKDKTSYFINLISEESTQIIDAPINMYSPKQASALMFERLENMNKSNFRLDSLQTAILAEFSQTLNFIPNIIYDEYTSTSFLEAEFKTIALTNGKVQKGEIIVQRGQLVNSRISSILFSLEEEYRGEHSENKSVWLYLGFTLIISLILLVYYLHLNFHFRQVLLSPKLISFIIIQMILMLGVSYLFAEVWDINLYLLPYVIFPILLYSFYDNRIALVSFWILILLSSFFAPNPFEFIVIQIVAGMIVLFTLRSIQKRYHLFITVLLVLSAYAVAYIGFSFIRHGSFEAISWINFVWFIGNAFLLLTLFPLIYIYEKIFGFLSDITLLELSDTNNTLLRALSEQAPGTFQHSMQVANLAETVVREIGGNPLLARAGALYHDVGKIEIPQYFIENQHGYNIHDSISHEDSAEIIISHVKNGVELAKKHRIPSPVINFITMHHGTSVTKYFYNSFVNENPDKEVDIKKFTYPGPKPINIETAVVMMVDAVEAATRSLRSYSEESITDLVNKIIDSQIADQQFENVDITFKNIADAKEVLVKKLINIYHARIE
ncbi:MAG: HDIG domain-containing protein, partial [Bacteroidales bacterium]|nr:HDIG domain-containing protein [Bacteroidales bacterium]